MGYKQSKPDKRQVMLGKMERRLAQQESIEPRIEGVPICDLQENFWSVGFEFPNTIVASKEDISEDKSFNLVPACPPIFKFNHWKIIKLLIDMNSNLKLKNDTLEIGNASITSSSFDCPDNQ